MKKHCFVKQEGRKDCGVACLLMILRTYGGDCSMELLRDLTNTTKEGTTAYDLLQTGKMFHFSTFGLRGKIEELKEEYFPVIAHVVKENVYSHFVVIYGRNSKKNTLLIADPAIGISNVKIEEFEKYATNQFFIFIQEGEIPSIITKHPIRNLFLSFIRKHWKKMFLLYFFSFLYTITSILSSFYLQVQLSFLSIFPASFIFLIGGCFLFLFWMSNLAHFLRVHLFIGVLHSLETFLLRHVYHHLFFLPDSYYRNRTTGELLARITDLISVKTTLANCFLTIFVDFLFAFVTGCVLFSFHRLLTLWVLFFVAIQFCFFSIFQKKAHRRVASFKESYAHVHSSLVDTLSSISMIRHLQREQYAINRLEEVSSHYQKESRSYQTLQNWQLFFQNIFRSFFYVCLVGYGFFLIQKGEILLPSFLSYLFLLSFFLEGINALFLFKMDWLDAKEVFQRIQEFYQIKEEKILDAFCVPIEAIEVKNLSFSYSRARIAFSNQTLSFQGGEKILIYGESGCGKSTFARILSGYENYQEGEIWINHTLLPNVDSARLRHHVTYVGQEDGLLFMSLRENILLGRNVSSEVFEQVCHICRVDEIVKAHPMGYDMLIEEDAANLSSGQKQRVILARSILTISDVYCFDESFCHLDVSLEREILKDLFSYFSNQMVIVISHRFGNEDLYDQKICFSKGGVLCKS